MLDRTPRSARPQASARLDSRSEVSMSSRSGRRCTFRPTPFDLRRFRRGLSGLFRSVTASGFDAGGMPLCGLPFSSKLSPSRLHPHTHTDAPLLGFLSPTALDNGGRPYSPMALQSHRHSPSSRFLTVSTASFALRPAGRPRSPLGCRLVRLRSWGSPGSFGSYRSCERTGPTDHGFPLQGSPQPRDERVFARSPLVRFSVLCAPPLSGASHQVQRALQSLDRRTVGVFRSGELRLPAFLRFLG